MSVNPRINITTINNIEIKTACFNGVRYYDPSLQRFLGEDSYEYISGDYNFYRYVGNDPVLFIDPLGLSKGGMMGDVTNGVRDGISPYLKDFYYFFVGIECKKILDDYDCSCYSNLECAVEKENLRNACKKLLARHARKELADKLLP